jgi:plasmid maintenance system antidote protein VapI
VTYRTRPNPTRVRPQNFADVLRRAGMSERTLANELGVTQQSVDRMVRGLAPASPRFARDSALILAGRLGEEPAFLRSLLFAGLDERPDERTSVLARRMVAATTEGGTDG